MAEHGSGNLSVIINCLFKELIHSKGFQGEMRHITYGNLRKFLAIKITNTEDISPRLNAHCKSDIL